MAWTLLPINVISDKIVLIKTLSSLPSPTLKDGVLTIIPGNGEYLLTQDIESPYPLANPGAGKRATFKSVNRAKWIYTGTDSCFRDLDAQGDIELSGLTWFEAPAGNMWNIDNTSGGAPWSFQASDSAKFTNMLSMGTVKGGVSGGGFNLHFGTLSDFNQGLIFGGTLFFEINLMFVFGNNAVGCTHFTAEGATTSGSINFITPTFSIGTNETVFNMKPEIQAGIDSLNFRGCQQEGGINGTVFAPGSLNQKSLKVVSAANNFIPPSRRIGAAHIKNNAIATDPVISGQWYDIDFGTGLIPGSTIERFTVTNPVTGEMRYDGETEFNGKILPSFTCISTGGDRIFYFRYVKNGLVLVDDIIAGLEIGAIVATIPMNVPVTLQTGDLIRPQLMRVDGSVTITVQQYSVNVD